MKTQPDDTRSRLAAAWLRIGLSVLLGFGLQACGGGEDPGRESPGPLQPGPTPGVPPQTYAVVNVTVVDPLDRPLRDALVYLWPSVPTPNSVDLSDITSGAGRVRFPQVSAGLKRIWVSHPLGETTGLTEITVPATGERSLTIRVVPQRKEVAALLAAEVVPGSLAPDGRRLQLRFELAVSDSDVYAGYPQGGWAECPAAPGDNCPKEFRSTNVVPNSEMNLSKTPLGSGPTGPWSALLLLDQSRRIRDFDPYTLRVLGLHRLIDGLRPLPVGDRLAVAAMAANDPADATNVGLLPQLPLWRVPLGAPAFTGDAAALRAAIDSVLSYRDPTGRTGGVAPLFSALEAALSAVGAEAPAGTRRAVIVLTGGGDSTGLDLVGQAAAIARIRQARTAAGAEILLLAVMDGPPLGEPDRNREERAGLVELARATGATLAFVNATLAAGLEGDQHYSALELALNLLNGTAPRFEYLMTVEAAAGATFVPGERLPGSLWLTWSGCSMGCFLQLPFAVVVP